MAIQKNRANNPLRIKEGDSVFQFIEGVSYQTFERDEEMRCGTVRTIYSFNPMKVEIDWTSTMRREILTVDETWIKPDKGLIVIQSAWDGTESGHLPQYMQNQYGWVCCARCERYRRK